MLIPDPEMQATLHAEALDALAVWGLGAGHWRLVGALPGAQGGLLRPVVRIEGADWVVRRQAPELTENDTRFRHTFMRHLADAGLPVPALRTRPDGQTWAVANGAIVELQAYVAGAAYSTDTPLARDQLAAAAQTLGALHQTSAQFVWQPYRWPEERSAAALALAYTQLIREAGETADSIQMRTGLERVADACEQRIAVAADLLAMGNPGPPQLHIHGDYQPHNLAFAEARVAAIYDFDAARWEQRIYEVAYALLLFTGVRWDAESPLTPALVDDGLDILRVHSFLAAYGREAPPAEDEAELLASALTLVFPIAFTNAVAEDIIFSGDYDGALDEDDALARLAWADRYWLWLDRYASTLAQAWENA
jgi:Ser/Thr protein kinase RdoA (MazF antagonist)